MLKYFLASAFIIHSHIVKQGLFVWKMNVVFKMIAHEKLFGLVLLKRKRIFTWLCNLTQISCFSRVLKLWRSLWIWEFPILCKLNVTCCKTQLLSIRRFKSLLRRWLMIRSCNLCIFRRIIGYCLNFLTSYWTSILFLIFLELFKHSFKFWLSPWKVEWLSSIRVIPPPSLFHCHSDQHTVVAFTQKVFEISWISIRSCWKSMGCLDWDKKVSVSLFFLINEISFLFLHSKYGFVQFGLFHRKLNLLSIRVFYNFFLSLNWRFLTNLWWSILW